MAEKYEPKISPEEIMNVINDLISKDFQGDEFLENPFIVKYKMKINPYSK